MRGLRAKAEEESRVITINHIIKMAYSSAINKATTTSETSDHYILQELGQNYDEKRDLFYKKNKEEIRQGLRRFFPDCSIEFKNLMYNPFDGKFTDVLTIDPLALQRNGETLLDCIVIDWS